MNKIPVAIGTMKHVNGPVQLVKVMQLVMLVQ
jgi:hypothetical protein